MTLYALRPDPVTGSIANDAEIVAESKYGWQFLEQAITLWRLVDRDRADRIQAVLTRAVQAAGEGELRFSGPDTDELVTLLSGIEDAIVASGIVNSHWRVPPEQLEELAKQVPAMDLKTERTLQNKTNALAEVMINAVSIRNFLSKAVDAGCVVVHD